MYTLLMSVVGHECDSCSSVTHVIRIVEYDSCSTTTHHSQKLSSDALKTILCRNGIKYLDKSFMTSVEHVEL